MAEANVRDQLRPVTLEKVQPEPLEPVGDVIIGKVDPKTLSREEFEKSSELLFHGAESVFSFQRKIISGPNSQTVGEGFYTTDDKKNAELYSNIRKDFKGDLVVLSLLPYDARMLDSRAKGNPLLNAPVPVSFAREFLFHIRSLVKAKFPDIETIKNDRTGEYMNLIDIKDNLEKQIRENSDNIELRSMLSASGQAGSSENGAPYFTEFMLGKGYDGLIYNEGGDHPDQKHTTSYVFYNLEKIGTYETWHH